jgi:predicted dehydrogenase
MDPIRIALIGAGRRGQSVYKELLTSLQTHRKIKVVAVCDPLIENAVNIAQAFNAKAYSSIQQLVKDKPMEACLVVTPEISHYGISIYLSQNKIHHAVETPMASTLKQCRLMKIAAEKNNVTLHINEQFFRRESIQLAKIALRKNIIGTAHRITSFQGHTGYHNNSVWQYLLDSKPVAVNCVKHTMPVHEYLDVAKRRHTTEEFNIHIIHFENGAIVTDMAGNIKSALGRYPRNGYLEIDGTHGTIIEYNDATPEPWSSKFQIRLVDEKNYENKAYADYYQGIYKSEESDLSQNTNIPHRWNFYDLSCKTPHETITYKNPCYALGVINNYQSSVATSLLNFIDTLQNKATLDFPLSMAIQSQEILSALELSAELSGARVKLPIADEVSSETKFLQDYKNNTGIDLMDIEQVINFKAPINYESKK